jgi:hypothetical protein
MIFEERLSCGPRIGRVSRRVGLPCPLTTSVSQPPGTSNKPARVSSIPSVSLPPESPSIPVSADPDSSRRAGAATRQTPPALSRSRRSSSPHTTSRGSSLPGILQAPRQCPADTIDCTAPARATANNPAAAQWVRRRWPPRRCATQPIPPPPDARLPDKPPPGCRGISGKPSLPSRRPSQAGPGQPPQPECRRFLTCRHHHANYAPTPCGVPILLAGRRAWALPESSRGSGRTDPACSIRPFWDIDNASRSTHWTT